jgi:transcriptional regulator with XRE-family HTH domain
VKRKPSILTNHQRAKKLKALRMAKGLKGYWVATRLGIGPGYLSNLERGKRRWTSAMVKNYLQAIGVVDAP